MAAAETARSRNSLFLVLAGSRRDGCFYQRASDELVVLTYKALCPGREWQDIDEHIGLSFSSCHYGGQRPFVVRMPDGGVWPSGRGFVPIRPPLPVPPLPFTGLCKSARG